MHPFIINGDSDCHSGKFCTVITRFQPDGLTTPLALFIVNSLPVGFLLFFLYQANRNYKQEWKTKAIRYSSVNTDLESGSSLSRRRNITEIPEKPSKKTSACCQGVSTMKLLPFYYTFIQFISLLYSLNFLLRGFFSYVEFINIVIVPILFCIMEFAQIYVIGIMFMKEMDRKNKGIVAMIAIFVALIDFVLEKQGIDVLNLSCEKVFSEYWICYTCIYLIVYSVILFLRRAKKPVVRAAVVPYVLVLLVIELINLVSFCLLYAGFDGGICLWLVSFFLYYMLYVPTLYLAFMRDSVYWHIRDRRKDQELSKQPLLSRESIGIDDDYVADWDDLRIIRTLGRGSNGEVFLGVHKGQEVAIKKMFLKSASEKEFKDFRRETRILSKLNHPNIVKLMGACIHPPNLAIIMEYVTMGTLQDLLYDPTCSLSFIVRLKMVRDVAKGVAYLHTQRPVVIHRDLKSSNLLVGHNYLTKISDFGIARAYEAEKRTMTMVGTMQWTAPEILRGEHYDTSVDVYSFGIILWELIVRQQPHEGMTSYEIITGVASNHLRPPIPHSAPPMYLDLMTRCWNEDSTARPKFSEVLSLLEDMITEEELKEWEFNKETYY